MCLYPPIAPLPHLSSLFFVGNSHSFLKLFNIAFKKPIFFQGIQILTRNYCPHLLDLKNYFSSTELLYASYSKVPEATILKFKSLLRPEPDHGIEMKFNS